MRKGETKLEHCCRVMLMFSFLGWSLKESIIIEATTGLLYQPRMIMDDDECGVIGERA
jgi:hypothetical protein